MRKPDILATLLVVCLVSVLAGCGGGGNPPASPSQPILTMGNEFITLDWAAVSGATSYEVWFGTSADSAAASKEIEIAETHYTKTGLTNGNTYYFWVKARNSRGTSGFSPPASGAPAASPPAAPGQPTLIPADGRLTVSWAAVPGATGYEVWYHTSDNSASAGQFGGDITSGTSCIITGLTNDTTYYVWIKAKNSAGTSGFSPVASGVPVSSLSPPEAPGVPVVTAGDSQLTVGWAAVTGATGYEVWYGTTSDNGSASQFGGDITTGTSCVIIGLTNGTTYYVWVKAKNSGGTSGFSPAASGRPLSPPATPGTPTVTAGNTQLTVSWAAVTGATSYQVWRNTTNNSGTATQYGGDIMATNCIITGLTNGTTYYVWVKAKNSAGTSGFSPVASGRPLSPPAAPGTPTITAGNTYLAVSWTAVSGATSYQVWRNTTNNSGTATQYGGDIMATTCVITGLTNGTTYYIWVKAKNSAGTSGFSPAASGKPRWTLQPGTSGYDVASEVAADGSGNIYVTGYTDGGLDGNVNAGGMDIFLAKYDAAGLKHWTRQLGTSANDLALGMAVDAGGNIYITGYTLGGLDGNTSAGDCDIFLVKYDSTGVKQWTRQLGNSSTNAGLDVAIGDSGNVYVTGHTYGGLDGNTSVGGLDMFLIKYNSAGTKLWTRQLGTADDDSGNSVSADGGNIYVTGSTGGGLDGNVSAGGKDIFLVKYDSTGTKLWTRQLGTSGDDAGEGVAIDGVGFVYATGYTCGGLNGNTGAGGKDIFLVKYSATGVRQWTRQLGTSGDDVGEGVAVDVTGNAYVTGNTLGGLDGNTSAGYDDVFLVKYNTNGIKQWTRQVGTWSIDIGYGIVVYASDTIYVSGTTGGGLDENTSAGGMDAFLVRYGSAGLMY